MKLQINKKWWGFFVFGGIALSSQAQLRDFAYQRPLEGINSTWHSVKLPNELFAKVRTDAADVRIMGITEQNDTIEAPFLRINTSERATEQNFDFPLINTAHNANGYYFTFELPTETTVNQILLDFDQKNFDWRAKVEGSTDQKEWFTLVENYRILAIENEQVNYRFSNISFPDAKYPYLRVCIKSKEKPAILGAKVKQITRTAGAYRTYRVQNLKSQLDKKTKTTEVVLDLPYAVPVSYLNLQVANSFDYYRPIQISYLLDSIKTDKGYLVNYQTITSGIISSLEKNEFTFPNVLAKRLKLSIENGDNEPLKIQNVGVKGSPDSLVVRFTQPATYFLVYGNPTATMPNYDLAAFRDKIPKEVSALSIGKETQRMQTNEPTTSPFSLNKVWLWVVMIAIIIVLGGFSVRMLKGK